MPLSLVCHSSGCDRRYFDKIEVKLNLTVVTELISLFFYEFEPLSLNKINHNR
ncbi:hypothetical protein PbDSM24746_34810 [Paenibacillus macerans]|nr:hypothetical protein PbDSM24746_34810 [Paenibacillus macerans]GBK69789.1 hypothetical protein PbJCM17693_34970 [Paenibacillus macerans]GIP10506.1 hypothetical protein J1TS5_26760 [Paenibacillus macerans]